MNAATDRVFEARPAERQAAGLLCSLVGPSGGGKTYTALRLAMGIHRVVGGEVDLIDTENRRALHYADRFKFNHVDFSAPFSPLDYLAAIRYCAKRGPTRTVIVDSMSHEHDGPGGVLEWHSRETERLAKAWRVSEEKAQLSAWNEPKSARKRLINEMLQLNVNLILTFRAKEKLKIVPGKNPIDQGWMPICGEEFMYEMALQILLPPAANGVPCWKPERPGERSMIKLPEQFKEFFGGEPASIDENMGEKLARWAAGGVRPAPNLDDLISNYAKCETAQDFQALEKKRDELWNDKEKPMPAGCKRRIKDASDAAKKRVGSQTAAGADPATWEATLQGASNIEQLTEMWESCSNAFGGMPPLQCESAYQLRREALAE